MAVIGAWLLFVVYPFYVYKLVGLNNAIVAAAAEKGKKKWWKFW